jgi:hypothetical protein
MTLKIRESTRHYKSLFRGLVSKSGVATVARPKLGKLETENSKKGGKVKYTHRERERESASELAF